MSKPLTPHPQNPRKRALPNSASSTPQSSSNPTKPSGHDRKRAKLADARAIAVQSTNQDIKSGQLDVNTFISSREFEIKALQNAMSNSKRANNKRAFQTVPREMRRRTASHNAKRVPKRLRARATHEMQEDNTPTVTSRRRKPSSHMRLRLETAKALHRLSKTPNLKEKLLSKSMPMKKKEAKEKCIDNKLSNPPRGHSKFRKRQKEKTWLPTHIWHAKRAKMVTRWKFAIAETPTEKSYRPTHRASGLRGAIAWDTSYFSTVMVKGLEEELMEVLKGICGDVKEVGGKLVKGGKRTAQTWAYRLNKYPTGPIAPITVIWQVGADPENRKPNRRQFLIRVHPSAFLELWNNLLAAAKSLKSVAVEDLRFELGSIEITGPAATDCLHTILRPFSDEFSEDSPEAIWNNLKSLTNPSALPPGALLAFDISDPRLRFPPRMTTDTQQPEEISQRLFKICSTWPIDKTFPPAALFSRKSRATAARTMPSQKRINRRKAEAAPGSYPEIVPTDPKIPVLLFATRRAGKEKGVNGAIGSWTLMLPWKWVRPVWYALMHTSASTRFGGIEEARQVTWENGMGTFPDDFPGTRAGFEEEGRKMKERKEVWERKPKGKRLAWESVSLGEGRKGEVGNGFGCDWEWFFKDKEKGELDRRKMDEAKEPEEMDLDPEPSGNSLIPLSLPPPPTFWVAPSALILPLLSFPPFIHPALSSLPPCILSKSVFTVKITFASRGTPLPSARIYSLPSPSASPALNSQWKSLISKPASKPSNKEKYRSKLRNYREVQARNRKPQAGNVEYPVCPGEEDLVGFVSTGGFSLKDGKGVGIGSLVFGRIFRELLVEGEKKLEGGAMEGRLKMLKVKRECVVRDAGCSVARGARWELA